MRVFPNWRDFQPVMPQLAGRGHLNSYCLEEDVTPDKIIAAVCSYFKQKKEDLLGKGKKADLAKARQICAYLLCEMLSLPLVSVGKLLGGRDHTTIMYARDKMESMVVASDKTAKEVDDIKSILLKQ